MKNPQFTMGEITRKCIAVLREAHLNETVRYEDLDKAIGVTPKGLESVQSKHRSKLYTAQKCLQKDGIFFKPIRNVGLTRVNHSDVVNDDNQLRKARKAAHRRASELRSVEYDNLPPADKLKHNVDATICAAVDLATHEETQKKIEGACEQRGHQVSPKISVGDLEQYHGV